MDFNNDGYLEPDTEEEPVYLKVIVTLKPHAGDLQVRFVMSEKDYIDEDFFLAGDACNVQDAIDPYRWVEFRCDDVALVETRLYLPNATEEVASE